MADELSALALGLRPDLDVAPIYVAAQQTAAVLRVGDVAGGPCSACWYDGTLGDQDDV